MNQRQVVPNTDPGHAFSRVPQADIQRSAFDWSHSVKTTINPDYLYPVGAFEVLPGQTMTLNPTFVVQALTLKQQLMDQAYIDFHCWFDPNRHNWVNWEKFQGERINPDDPIDYSIPQLVYPNAAPEGSLGDYLGLPITPDQIGTNELSVNALYTRAYNNIVNTWYRDQNFIDSIPHDTDNGPDDPADYVLRKRGKRKDYFTSLLPWAQKGDPVSIALGGTAPVTGSVSGNLANGNVVVDAADSWLANASLETTGAGGGAGSPSFYIADGSSDADVSWRLQSTAIGTNSINGTADLSAATAITINALRLAFTIQQLLERDARGGTRYTEIIHSHFGVTSPDARLQRPEYLGGGTVPVIWHSVVNTNQASGSTLGNRAAYGHAQSRGGLGFTQSFTEHGVVLCLISIRQDYTYQQGLDRKWTRLTRYDYYMPVFAHLGEQAVKRSELLWRGEDDDDETAGYQERWAEYRWHRSYLTGKMRSTATGTLDSWHLAQELDSSSKVVIDQDFIEENVPFDRVVNVPSEPIFNFDCYMAIRCVLPMPLYSDPGLRIM